MIANYRIFIIHKIPNLKIFDEIKILDEEKLDTKNILIKKSAICKNKIIESNRISKSIFKMMKNFKLFFKLVKILEINFLRKKTKMLEFLK